MSNMSKPVAVPETVEVELSPGRLRLKGPLGESERTIPPALEVHYDAERRLVSVRRTGEDRSSRALQGLYRTLVANMVQGVSSGFRKALEVHGTGYRTRRSRTTRPGSPSRARTRRRSASSPRTSGR